jgi:hypothetical protein
MANWTEPTDKEKLDWKEWVANRPECIRSMIEKFEFTPWKLYKLQPHGHRVTLVSFEEHKDSPPTLKVAITAQFNLIVFERGVFGVKPEDLEECDLPSPNEPVGCAIKDPKEALEYVRSQFEKNKSIN